MSAAALRGWFPDAGRRRMIFTIALPIIGGMVSQNILNLVDIAMVGHLGDVALAATGVGSFANYLALSFILGLSAGVQALAARRLGEERHGETAVALNGGLLLSLVIGIPLTLLFLWLTPMVFPLLNDDAAVISQGEPYLEIRLLAIAAVGMNFSFRGYWSAIHLTGIYLRTILVMHAINIFLNWVLIFGNLGAPELGVTGAGLASTIAIYFGTLLYFLQAWRRARDKGFLQRVPRGQELLHQLRVSLPASIQQLMFSAGLVALVFILGLIGTAEVAAANVLATLHLVALLPAMGIGLATATLVGNALGRNDVEDAMRWGWNAALLTLGYGVLMALIIIPFAGPILAVFIHNPETRELARLPLIIWALGIALDTAGLVLMNGMMGAGDTRRAMMISVLFQWLIFLPLAYLSGPYLGGGLLAVWIVFTVYRAGQGLYLGFAWRQGNWRGVSV